MDLIKHPAFKEVDHEFITSLEKTISSVSGKSDIEVIGTLMAISNEANKKNVQFTSDMQIALLEYLKSRIPAHKQPQFEALVSLIASKMS